LVKEKKAEDISLVMLATLLGGLMLWISYGVMKKDSIIIISNAFALLVNLATVGLASYYKRR
jgi:MtN3 and saliva related transmembrane protein